MCAGLPAGQGHSPLLPAYPSHAALVRAVGQLLDSRAPPSPRAAPLEQMLACLGAGGASALGLPVTACCPGGKAAGGGCASHRRASERGSFPSAAW